MVLISVLILNISKLIILKFIPRFMTNNPYYKWSPQVGIRVQLHNYR